jgi:hypothetical protein
MIFSLLAFALIRRAAGQVNPPGTNVAPTQAAFYSASGGTGTIEVRNSQGQLVPLLDTAGVPWPNATITFPEGTAVGLGWEITQTMPDGVHPLAAIGSTQYSVIVRMNANASESPVGTYDSSVGAGNGIAAGYPAPTATSPTLLLSGSTYVIGFGSVITGASPTSAVGNSNGFSNLNAFSSGGEASNTVTTTASSLTLSGGGDPAASVCVIVTNAGTYDVWVSPYSGGHTWLCPAGGTTYIPSGSTALFGLANGGTSTVYCTKAGR